LYVFADLLRLPAAIYHAIYFLLVGGVVTLYVARTGLPLRATLRRRLGPGLLLGAVGGLALMQRVLAESPSAGPQGLAFAWDFLWRGLIHGAMDGVLLPRSPGSSRGAPSAASPPRLSGGRGSACSLLGRRWS
jgi:hypothetical protein